MNSSGNSLNELEAKLSNLERANFDLKMQLYYLNKKYAEVQSQSEDNDGSTSIAEQITPRLLAINLKEENEYFKLRVVELESEIRNLQLLRESDNAEYQRTLHSKPHDSFAIIDESRRRERDAVKVIAEHDANLISKLRTEIGKLESIHENDQRLLDELTSTLSQQIEQLESKDSELEVLRCTVAELKSKVELLVDTAMHQEQVISGLQSSKSSPTRSLAMDSSTVAELDALKQENASLRGQVERQNASILNQSEAINRLETSTSTILFCDEEEMKLLKQDLVRARNDKVQLQKLLRSSQKELEDLQQTNADVNSRLQFMERQMSHSSRLLRYADHAELHHCAVLYHRACPLTSTLLGNERKNY